MDANLNRGYAAGQKLLQMMKRIPALSTRTSRKCWISSAADRRRPPACRQARGFQRDVANNMLTSLAGSTLVNRPTTSIRKTA